MNIIEREKLILKRLETTDCLTVEEIAELTGASLPTVRRDLNLLVKKYGLARFRGGIGNPVKKVSDNSHNLRADRISFDEDPGYLMKNQLLLKREEKFRIAREASKYVQDGDTVYIDSSTTAYYISEFLRGKDIMVVTNGVDIMTRLIDYHVPTYVLNGQVNQTARCILGIETADQLRNMNFDKAFIGARGIDEVSGFTTTDNLDSMLKTIAISKATESYVLADSSKFFQRKLHTYAALNEAVIITDDTNGFSSEEARIIQCDRII